MTPSVGLRQRARRTMVALFLATLMLAVGMASWWSREVALEGSAARVEVEGGAVVEARPGHVTVVATGPDCTVYLSTPEGEGRPAPFALSLVNVGAGTNASGFDQAEHVIREGRDIRAAVDPALGWPRTIAARLPDPVAGGNWTFIAMGDPQGHDWNVEAAGGLAEAMGARFILLLGDLTASGEQDQYDSLARAMDTVDVPIYAVPGNHDVMNYGAARFVRAFGARDGAFDYGGVRFVLLDTSAQTFTDTEATLLADASGGRPAGERLVVATHTSPVDPRPHGMHTFIGPGDSERIMAAAEAAGTDLFLAGHVHMYCSTATLGGVPLVVTGGGGGILIASEGPWNFHHLLRVDVNPRNMTWAPIPLSDQRPGGMGGVVVEVVPRHGQRAPLALDELVPLATADGTWSFEDRYGNWEARGRYVGVPVGSLVSLMGGMGPRDRVEVAASDGYKQAYSYANVFPDAQGRAEQGEMVLAISFDGVMAPTWEEGPRLIFTPTDGRYSTADAEATTDPAMRADPFSAGTRWVRDVASMEILPGG